MENKMKTYLGIDYNETNHIMNWLNYWTKNPHKKGNNYDNWRKENDLDCIYFNGCLYGDTIISMWSIICMAIICINPKQKIKKTYDDITNIKQNFDLLFPHNDLLCEKLNELAKLAELRQNFMILPKRVMQNRGFFYADQMSPTLYQCFEDGRYSKLFDDITVKEWVACQKLNIAFIDGVIDREHIKPTIEGLPTNKSIKKSKKRDTVLKLINSSIAFLKDREELFDN